MLSQTGPSPSGGGTQLFDGFGSRQSPVSDILRRLARLSASREGDLDVEE